MPQVINGQSLNSTEGFDKITSTDKITAGYFTDGLGKLIHSQITSASLQSSQENYYYGIAKGNQTGSIQFHVAYGNVNGHGSDTDSGNVPGKTKAVYKQWSNILLPENEITGGFNISKAGSSSVLSTRDEGIFVLVGKRALFKDRINKKNWTITLSGSSTNPSESIDDEAFSAVDGFPPIVDGVLIESAVKLCNIVTPLPIEPPVIVKFLANTSPSA